MSDEGSETPSNPPRASRFREHTNTSNSIRPPPDELWKDIAIDNLIDKFNEENAAPPPTSRKSSRENSAPELRRLNSDKIKNMQKQIASVTVVSESAQPVTSGNHESTLGRLQRAWASMFGNVLGKRKAGAVDAEKDKAQQLLDDRKKAAEAAYHEAKELGLLPTPKVFVRPGMAAMSHNCATPVRTPRTPSLYRSPSKKDLQKQKRLSKRVSNLESKLASARKELQSVLHTDLPPLPPLPALHPPTPATSHDSHESAPPAREPSHSPPPVPVCEPILSESEAESQPPSSSRSLGKVIKKRKARLSIDDAEYIPMTTDSEADMDLLSASSEPELEPALDNERTIKRLKSAASPRNSKAAGRRSKTRLSKRGSRSSLRREREERAVTVVPDGVKVPHVPALPESVRGKKVVVFEDENAMREREWDSDGDEDMYGGLEHEMF